MNHELPPIDIQGERVRIRLWQRRDVLAQERWPGYTDPFSNLWNLPRAIAVGDDDDIWFSFSTSQRRVWAIEDRQQQLIGRISLREIEQQARRARLGISMGAPYVGQRLGTEALTLFLDYFFSSLGFATMRLDVAAFNRRAVRCYERLGFHYVGSDWRNAGSDPALHLLDEPAYHHLRPFFRRERHGAFVQFYEMELQRHQWINYCQRP